MTDDTDTVDIEDVNLDDFEKSFFKSETTEETNDEHEDAVDETEEDNSLATDDDEDEDAEEQEEAEDEDEEEIVEVPQPKQKRNRAQERIEQLLERERLANERAHTLEVRLAKLEAGKEVNQKEETPSLREQLSADAPSPDAKDKDGNAVYELGEFDPKFIRDLTKFTIEQETKAARASAEAEARQAQIEAAQEEIRNRWVDNLDKAEAEMPEIRENIRTLTDTFENIEPIYGEYLAATIMNMDFGPQLMNYLSQNIGEARKIVASGPAAATLALGRLESKFATSTVQEEKRNSKQVSHAPPPPDDRVRGRSGKFVVAPDTDDLNAFEREFFK